MDFAWPFKPPCRHPGLPQGYVLLGSMAHRILLALHAAGDLRLVDLVDELDADMRFVSTLLKRLQAFHFVYCRHKVRGRGNVERTQYVWTLQPCRYRALPRESCAARAKRYRQAKKLRAASVFDFRGRIAVTPSETAL